MRACYPLLGEILRLLHDGCILRDDNYGASSHSLHSLCNPLLPQTGCSQIRVNGDRSSGTGATETTVGLNNWSPHEQFVTSSYRADSVIQKP